jgi:hypothetical protein
VLDVRVDHGEKRRVLQVHELRNDVGLRIIRLRLVRWMRELLRERCDAQVHPSHYTGRTDRICARHPT